MGGAYGAGRQKARPDPFRLDIDIGGAEEDRTPDLFIANAALSQLSYRPMTGAILMKLAGLKKADRDGAY